MNIEHHLSGPNQTSKPEAGSNVHLRKYVTLAESSISEQNLIDIIKQALESPSIYVFGELLDVPNVNALRSSAQYEPYLKLLDIFAYGTYQDYKKSKQESSSSLPDLTEPMVTKLRQLSIVSLAKYRRHISYEVLLKELDMDNIRHLEDLIIEVIYANIIKGTMDQQNNRLEIDQTIARDVREEDFNTITNVLNEWCRTCENILSNIEHQIQTANNFKEESSRAKHALESKIISVRKSIKTNENDDSMMTDANNIGYYRDPGEKIKRTPCKSIKTGYKFNYTKSWRRDN